MLCSMTYKEGYYKKDFLFFKLEFFIMNKYARSYKCR
jgi:hypothetical protein